MYLTFCWISLQISGHIAQTNVYGTCCSLSCRHRPRAPGSISLDISAAFGELGGPTPFPNYTTSPVFFFYIFSANVITAASKSGNLVLIAMRQNIAFSGALMLIPLKISREWTSSHYCPCCMLFRARNKHLSFSGSSRLSDKALCDNENRKVLETDRRPRIDGSSETDR